MLIWVTSHTLTQLIVKVFSSSHVNTPRSLKYTLLQLSYYSVGTYWVLSNNCFFSGNKLKLLRYVLTKFNSFGKLTSVCYIFLFILKKEGTRILLWSTQPIVSLKSLSRRCKSNFCATCCMIMATRQRRFCSLGSIFNTLYNLGLGVHFRLAWRSQTQTNITKSYILMLYFVVMCLLKLF